MIDNFTLLIGLFSILMGLFSIILMFEVRREEKDLRKYIIKNKFFHEINATESYILDTAFFKNSVEKFPGFSHISFQRFKVTSKAYERLLSPRLLMIIYGIYNEYDELSRKRHPIYREILVKSLAFLEHECNQYVENMKITIQEELDKI